jgi:hypothetical protein
MYRPKDGLIESGTIACAGAQRRTGGGAGAERIDRMQRLGTVRAAMSMMRYCRHILRHGVERRQQPGVLR